MIFNKNSMLRKIKFLILLITINALSATITIPTSNSKVLSKNSTFKSDFIICIHINPKMDQIYLNNTLDLIENIGARGVRTDVGWSFIEPEYKNYDHDSIEFYKNFFELCRKRNLTESMLIFSSPPKWAENLWAEGKKDLFLESWANYVEIIVKKVGISENIKRYQIWNEFNSIPSFKYVDNTAEIINTAGIVLKKYLDYDKTLIYINPNADFNYFHDWIDYLNQWCKNSGQYFNSIGLDHYPGTWTFTEFIDWTPLKLLLSKTLNNTDPCYGKTLSVLETGYSSWSSWLNHGESQQTTWFSTSLKTLLDIVNETKNFDIIGIYELYDEGSWYTFPPQEANFGLIRNNNEKKPAYNVVRSIIAGR